MPNLVVVRSSTVGHRKTDEVIGDAHFRFCTQGDSWFSLGSNDPLNGGLLREMVFSSKAVAVDSSKWGKELAQMVIYRRERFFERMLNGPGQWKWDGILLSCGGNDLIAAAQVRAKYPDGTLVESSKRILRRKDEWGDPSMGPSRFLSEEGWQTFAHYFKTNLGEILALRDKGPSKGRPVFFHGYGFATPRPSPLNLLVTKVGPWLYPSMVDYGIPEEDGFIPLARELISRFNALGREIADENTRFPNVHFLDTTNIPLVAAQLRTRGSDGDWDNEIHLTTGGLRKVAREYVALIERVLAQQGLTHL